MVANDSKTQVTTINLGESQSTLINKKQVYISQDTPMDISLYYLRSDR
jgi:hypothetical protein